MYQQHGVTVRPIECSSIRWQLTYSIYALFIFVSLWCVVRFVFFPNGKYTPSLGKKKLISNTSFQLGLICVNSLVAVRPNPGIQPKWPT